MDTQKIVLIRPLMGIMDLIHKTPPVSLLALCRYLDVERYPVILVDQCMPGWQATLQEALSQDTLLVGISCLTGNQQEFGGAIASLVRRVLPSVPIVWGGTHPSALPLQTLKESNVDIVVVGEGDVTFPELVEALSKGSDLETVKGIAFKDKQGTPHQTAPREMLDMENLAPFPYHLIDLKPYANVNQNFGLIVEAGRGCMYSCSFCYNPSFNQKRWRPRPAREIYNEMCALNHTEGTKVFHLCDDSFFTSPERVWEFVRLVEEGQTQFQWNAEGNLHHVQKLGREGIIRLKNSGLHWLSVGIESGSEKVRRFFNRPVNISNLLEFNALSAKIGLHVEYNFMTGAPIEEEDDVRSTASLILQLLDTNPYALVQAAYITVPYPKTRYLEQCKEFGLKEPASFSEWAMFDPFFVADSMPWMTRKKKAMFESFMFDTLFVDEKGNFHKTSSLFSATVSLLARNYHGFARWRIKKFIHQPTWPGSTIKLVSKIHRNVVASQLGLVELAIRLGKKNLNH